MMPTFCAHHWILEPYKREALGRCVLCGVERTHSGGVDEGDPRAWRTPRSNGVEAV